MSFGFSVGDFITVGSLIADIVTSLRAASIAEYRELILELHGLERALHEIEHLKCTSSQGAAVNGIKVAALMCQYPLDDFSAKLKKFERLGFDGGKRHSRLEIMKIWTRKLQWGFCMKEETEKLRTYIVVHVGSLNMRLITQGLVSTSLAAERADRGLAVLEGRLDHAHQIICQTQHGLDLHNLVAQNNESMLKKLSSVVTRDIASQLKTLVDLASKIWDSHQQVIGFMIKIHASLERPNSRFTWAQDPVRFEDALGDLFPIPSEYNCRKVEAIIKDQFRDGLGHQKVSAGEYELFNTFDSSKTVSLSADQSLIPGMAITMAIVIGQYESGPLSHCPRLDCRSIRVVPNEAGGMRCLICSAWFDLARNSLPRPLRPPLFEYQETRKSMAGSSGTKRKRDITDTGEQPDIQQSHLKLRMERKRFKNVRVHFTKLPETARPRNGRSLSPYSKQRQTIWSSLKDHNSDQSVPAHRTAGINLTTHEERLEDRKLPAFSSCKGLRGARFSFTRPPSNFEDEEPLLFAMSDLTAAQQSRQSLEDGWGGLSGVSHERGGDSGSSLRRGSRRGHY